MNLKIIMLSQSKTATKSTWMKVSRKYKHVYSDRTETGWLGEEAWQPKRLQMVSRKLGGIIGILNILTLAVISLRQTH